MLKVRATNGLIIPCTLLIQLSDGRYTLRSAKLFGDGALGSRGAALLDDYSDKPGSRGFLIRPERDWEPLIRQYYENVSRFQKTGLKYMTCNANLLGMASCE